MRAFVVPTRNEQDTIGDLVRRLLHLGDMVVVADDSDDLTAIVALSEGATVLDVTGGLGPAYLAAWEKIPPEWDVIHVDAGGSHLIRDIQRVAGHHGEVVIGSRFMAGGRHTGPVVRRVSSRLAAAAMNLITWKYKSDWTSGLRKYSPLVRSYLAEIDFKTTGHAWQLESLWHLTRGGWTAVDVPIEYRPSSTSLSTGRVVEAASLWWRLTWRGSP